MYGVAIGGVSGKEVPPGVSGQRWQQQLSQRAAPWGRGPFWVACHSRNTHSLGTNRFLGWHKWWGVPLGSTVYWVWTESQRWCPTGNELLMAQPPYTEGVSCQSHDYSQGPSICATRGWQPTEELVIPVTTALFHLPPQSWRESGVLQVWSCQEGCRLIETGEQSKTKVLV